MNIKFDFSITRAHNGLNITMLSPNDFTHTDFLQHDFFFISNFSFANLKNGFLIIDLLLQDRFYFLSSSQPIKQSFCIGNVSKAEAFNLLSQTEEV